VRPAVWLVIALIALNVVFDAAGMRLRRLPDNPVVYKLLKRAP
jgi:hypothetical protein